MSLQKVMPAPEAGPVGCIPYITFRSRDIDDGNSLRITPGFGRGING